MSTFSPNVLSEIAESCAERGGSPRRRDTIERIIRINASASGAFLERFADAALRAYLDHLESAQQPRGPRAVWVRAGETPAVCGGG